MSALNLRRLRASSDEAEPSSASLRSSPFVTPVTRRLSLQAGAALFLARPAIAQALGKLGQRIQFRFDGRSATFLLDGSPAWVVDPARFSGSPRLRVKEDSRSIRLRLIRARYPGSKAAADFNCLVRKGSLQWTVQLEMLLGEFCSEGDLEAWLAHEQKLESPVQACGMLIRSRRNGASLALNDRAVAAFSPDWRFEISGSRIGTLELSNVTIPAKRVMLGLPLPGEESLASAPDRRRTRFAVVAAESDRSPLLDANLLQGGELRLGPGALDRFDLEAHEGVEGHRLYYVASSSSNEAPVLFRPGSAYLTVENAPAEFALRDLRLAGFVGPHSAERALVSNLGTKPVWLQADSSQLKLGDLTDDSVLEVFERSGSPLQFKFAPSLVASVTPLAGAVALETEPKRPIRVALQSERPNDGNRERCGLCRADGAGGVQLDLPCFEINVVRPSDLLVLRFELLNLRIDKKCFREPRLVRAREAEDAFVIVHFPPQHLAERAFDVSEEAKDPPLVSAMDSRLAGESRLVFRIKRDASPQPFTLAALLNWNAPHLEMLKVPPERSTASIKPPTRLETDVEFPWRLHISPDDGSIWSHSGDVVDHEERAELWHTRLLPENPWVSEVATVRAVFADRSGDALKPTSLTDENCQQIVTASHDAAFDPSPVSAHLLALSSLGAWADLRGDWPCTERRVCNPLQKWTHLATMGRDQKVVVELRGFQCRTGHRAVHVIETERELKPIGVTIDGRPKVMHIAFLRQRHYLKIMTPVRQYDNWDMPHRSIEILDKRTPDLDAPNSEAAGSVPKKGALGETWGSKAFWPTVGGQPFQFRMRGLDYSGAEQTWLEPLLFIEQGCDPIEPGSQELQPVNFLSAGYYQEAIDHYNASPRRTIPMGGQSVSMAPSYREGDTAVGARQAEFKVLDWRAPVAEPCWRGYLRPDSPTWLRRNDPCEPPFWPVAERIEATIPAVESFLGSSTPTWLTPVSIECDAAFETFAELSKPGATEASFHQNTQRSGGGLGPSPKISHLSRRFGPVGLGSQAAAVRNASPADAAADASIGLEGSDFFGDDATLLGTITLKDIIASLSPADGTVPALLSLLTPFADGPDYLQQSLNWETTSLKEFELPGEILAFEPEKDQTKFAIDGSFSIWVGEPESARFTMQGRLEKFAVRIGFTSAGARVHFTSLVFSAMSDGSTSFDVNLGEVEFLGALAFIQTIAQRLKEFVKKEVGVEVDLRPDGLTVWMPPINLDKISFGIVTIKNLNIHSWVVLPFKPDPVELGFSFGKSDAPCELQVGIYGGTAYLLIVLDTNTGGLRRLEACLEFGVLREVSFGPAHGRVYLLGGVFYGVASENGLRKVVLNAFVRAGGSVDVLGLITAYVDLYIGLHYESSGADSFLLGEASLSIGFKIVLVRYNVTLRRAERLAGSSSSARRDSAQSQETSTARLGASVRASKIPICIEPARPTVESMISKSEWVEDYWASFASSSEGSCVA